MKKLLQSAILAAVVLLSNAAYAQEKDVVDIAAGSEAHSTLVAAVKAAGLVETLKGAGPFTVFAPVNDAFGKLPAGTVDFLLKPENKATLVKILTYHVVAGNLDANAVVAAIKAGKGNAVLTTVSGNMLTATIENGKVKLTDEKGGVAFVTVTDLKGSNGIIHVIDTVVLPK
ncbi:MAG: fasciclin domain-containing protein [Chitinophagaceae bacterium]|nr:fasciclin domain-containing protein [Chitinophagaceae bacterium]